MILIKLLTAAEGTERNQLMDVGVAGVIGDVLIFQAGPGRAGDDFTRLRLNIAEADFFLFFVQRQMRMVTPGDFAQRAPGFYRYVAIGFRRQRQDHLCGVDSAVDIRTTGCRPFRFDIVEYSS